MLVSYLKTVLGVLRITEEGKAIVEIQFDDQVDFEQVVSQQSELLDEAKKQLNEYFEGTRETFSFPIDQKGTPFQTKVWQALCHIPYGTLTTYQAIAKAIHHDKAVRAVGGANHRNKLAIVVPCHRVVGANGKKPGYNGGVWRMEWLIAHEQNQRTSKNS